jgi:hypothetical protein
LRRARRQKYHMFNRGRERATGAAAENPGPASPRPGDPRSFSPNNK